jgi:geranylgeranyl diphosphate/geranylgeranyl-bacteriochlorophyllide a reductase
VALLERFDAPRAKCCAGGVLERALKLLDFELPQAIIERELQGFHLQLAGHRYGCRAPARLGVTVRRKRFDQFIREKAEKAGAKLMQGHELESFDERKDRVVSLASSLALESRYLVLAEGANSRNARKALGPFPKGTIAIGAAVEADMVLSDQGSVGFHLLEESRYPGSVPRSPLNGAVFPLGSTTMVSVVGAGRSSAQLTDALRKVIMRETKSIQSVTPCFHALPLAPRARVCTRRIAAVGDAAGFVSPFSGEGMTYALTSSILAARAIEKARASPQAQDLSGYESACRSGIVERMKAAETYGSLLLRSLYRADPRTVEGAFQDTKLVSYCTFFARGELSTSNFVAKLMARVPAVLARSRTLTRV